MTAPLVKMLPLLCCWGGICLAFLHAFADRKRTVVVGAASGWLTGIGISCFLLLLYRGEFPFTLLKSSAGMAFLFLFAVSVGLLYRSAGVIIAIPRPLQLRQRTFAAIGAASLAALPAGAFSAARIMSTGDDKSLLPCLLLALAGVAVIALVFLGERLLPEELPVTAAGLVAITVALLLLVASSSPRLDIFAPLTMKVMKFIHDFVHQFFESMLIPDHPFFRSETWGYIGLLFSNSVGFWAGLVIWFIPSLFILAALGRERLPSVAHLRQGAKRRRLLGNYLRERRRRLVVPFLAMFVMAVAVYQSRFPAVEYWDPKPVAVTANQAGEIVIARKGGEVDLEDGRLHKFSYQREGVKVRFLVLMKPDGQLTVTLDACSICQPDGYGQSEGNVICFYCKTLIPLETVGKPGGCNPVPVPFRVEPDAVRIEGRSLAAAWLQTAQTVKKGAGGGK